MGVDTLPELEDDDLVAELLEGTTFKSALGRTWRTGSNGEKTFAPTTTARFHIVPEGYQAGYIAVNRDSCIRCHQTVNRNVALFDAGRDWYGRIRGADGIFSFHPFEPSSISDNGYPRGVSLRRVFLDAGVLERYDAGKHSTANYQRVPHLE